MEKEIKEDKMLEFRYVIKDETGLHARPAGMLAKLVRADPAIMAAPLITTIVDAGAVLIYFQAAAALLRLPV